MKQKILVISFLTFCFGQCYSLPFGTSEQQSSYDSITTNLQVILDEWCRGNPIRYTEMFDMNLTFFNPGSPEILSGIDSLKTYFTSMGSTKSNLDYCKMTNPSFRYFGNAAVLSYNLIYPEVAWQATEVYARTHNVWKIVHSHWSVIPLASSIETSGVNWKTIGLSLLILVFGFVSGRLSTRVNSRNK